MAFTRPVSTVSTPVDRLSTYLSGQATGRIGNSAGVLGSRGTPTSMRGRFAKFGARYGDRAGAAAAMMPTESAFRTEQAGGFASLAERPFDAAGYEAAQRRKRGLTTSVQELQTPILPAFWRNRNLPMMKTAANPVPPALYKPPTVQSLLGRRFRIGTSTGGAS